MTSAHQLLTEYSELVEVGDDPHGHTAERMRLIEVELRDEHGLHIYRDEHERMYAANDSTSTSRQYL